MSRIKLTILGTIWVSIVLAGYILLGTNITAEDAAYFYYSLGLLVAAAFSSVPFFIYYFTKPREEEKEK